MDLTKMKRAFISVFAGYIAGIVFARFSYFWARPYADVLRNIPKKGFPVDWIALFIVADHGWYTLLVLTLFIFAAWILLEPYRNAVDKQQD